MVGQSSYLGVATGDWVATLNSGDPLERRLASHALAEIGPAAREAIPAVVAGTRDELSFVRSLAAWHLGRLGPTHPGIKSVVPELRELLNDTDPSVRAEALVTMENLAGQGAPPAELKSLAPTT